jgi:thymidylate synthase ThyX
VVVLRTLERRPGMAFQCRVERDSITTEGCRLTTFVVTYPREVSAEVRTHRTLSAETEVIFSEKTLGPDLSMNSASSRAIPVKTMLQMVRDDPYYPIHWGAAQRGMQADEELSPDMQDYARERWGMALHDMLVHAQALAEVGAHKQIANRLLEPFSWVTQVVTGTDDNLANFFALRCHRAAHPSFQRIARMMFLAYRESRPQRLDLYKWHLPFTCPEDGAFCWRPHRVDATTIPDLLARSAARCGRVSYLKHDGESATLEDDRNLCQRMAGESPVHASVFEHQATPDVYQTDWLSTRKSNLTGWLQLRKLIPQERVMEYRPSEEEIQSWGLSQVATTGVV